MNALLAARLQAACKVLHRDIRGSFCSGAELVGIIELHDGRHAQLQVRLTTEDEHLIDVDAPTGCGDDLVITAADFD